MIRKATLKRKQLEWALSKTILSLGLCCLFLLLVVVESASSKELSAFEQCLIGAMEAADDSATMGELRQRCRRKIEADAKSETAEPTVPDTAEKEGALDERLAANDAQVLKPFALMAHRPNYFLIASYNASGINSEPYRDRVGDRTIDMQNVEAKFQMSFKMPLLVALLNNRIDVFAAYTNRSFWQVYNDAQSSPFREINHEPEVWAQVRNDWKLLGFTNRLNAFGFVHQSNGRGGTLSRSWNRLYVDFLFERENWVISLKSWYLIKEDRESDDNPDITDYMGNGELRTAYKWKDNTFSMMLRNCLESGFSRGTVELGWSFPLWNYPYFKGYVQYFNGYGESMIDYNEHANSIGAGVLLTDWL